MARKNPHAVALGRKGGRVSSAKKTAANRRNARRAGRKPKFMIGDRATTNRGAPAAYRDRVAIVNEIGPRKSVFGVAFTDGREPATGYMMSWWLDVASAKGAR